MDCARVEREEILVSYLLGQLSDEEREAVEEHYFECARCFQELQTLQATRDELQQTRAELKGKTAHAFPWWFPAAGLAAAALVIGAILWMRTPLPSRLREGTGTPSPSQAQVPGSTNSPQPYPSIAPPPSLEQLARFEPPLYEPKTLRRPSDEAMERFQRGMEHYRRADYAGAIGDLRTAADLDPQAAHIGFFLGISYLMSGQDRAAIDRLQTTIGLGDSAYLEDAHFYLAKAFLRRADLSAAETQLKEVVKLRGSRSTEAQRMLTEIERFKQR